MSKNSDTDIKKISLDQSVMIPGKMSRPSNDTSSEDDSSDTELDEPSKKGSGNKISLDQSVMIPGKMSRPSNDTSSEDDSSYEDESQSKDSDDGIEIPNVDVDSFNLENIDVFVQIDEDQLYESLENYALTKEEEKELKRQVELSIAETENESSIDDIVFELSQSKKREIEQDYQKQKKGIDNEMINQRTGNNLIISEIELLFKNLRESISDQNDKRDRRIERMNEEKTRILQEKTQVEANIQKIQENISKYKEFGVNELYPEIEDSFKKLESSAKTENKNNKDELQKTANKIYNLIKKLNELLPPSEKLEIMKLDFNDSKLTFTQLESNISKLYALVNDNLRKYIP